MLDQDTKGPDQVQMIPDQHGCNGIQAWFGSASTAFAALLGLIGSIFSYRKGKLGTIREEDEEYERLKTEVAALKQKDSHAALRQSIRAIIRQELGARGGNSH